MKTNTHFLSYLADFFLERVIFQTEFVEKIKTQISCSVTFFRLSFHFRDKVAKYCRARHATEDSTAHVLCMLDN
jgi:hypothetical protein